MSCLKNLRKAILVVELIIIFVLISVLTVGKINSYANNNTLALTAHIFTMSSSVSKIAEETVTEEVIEEQIEEPVEEESVDEEPIEESYEEEYSEYDESEEDYGFDEFDTQTVSAEEFMVQGVVYYNGMEFTWYSENVLPGGGLDIPGRHSDENGYICDCDGYICVASCDYEYGTVLDTPFGYAKVYDVCPVSGIVDVYVSW